MPRKIQILFHIHKNILFHPTLTEVAMHLFSARVLSPILQDFVFSWIYCIRKSFEVSLHSYGVIH